MYHETKRAVPRKKTWKEGYCNSSRLIFTTFPAYQTLLEIH